MASKSDRAKQFLPFNSLKGLQEALREKEIEIEDKKELSEESYVELEKEFNRIEKGSKIKITYYKNKRYIDIIGIVTNIDYRRKKIQIDDTQNINMSDIINIQTII